MRCWISPLLAGAAAGAVAEATVLRLNPEIDQSLPAVLILAPAWMSWGAVGAGLPLLLLGTLLRRLRRGEEERWRLPGFMALVYAVAAVMSWVNAELHPEFVSRTGQRILRQDAHVWLAAMVFALLVAAAFGRNPRSRLLRVGFAAVLLALPLVRLATNPTVVRRPLEVVPRPLGVPSRPMLVVGVEGLDRGTLLAHAGERLSTLDRLQREGSVGPYLPNPPHLRRSLWTSVATGTWPGTHGVKSRWAWKLPLGFGEPLRLLPWTPQGSRLILPWGLASRVEPPPATVPALWERLRASDVRAPVLDWPGIWSGSAGVTRVGPVEPGVGLDAALDASLERAMAKFPDEAPALRAAVARDLERVAIARRALAAGARTAWVFLESVAAARIPLEPVRPVHTEERSLLELMMELLDEELAELMDAAGPDVLVAVVSPYGLAPPTPWERLRRLLGVGGTWRTSAETSPEGIVLLYGPGVLPGGALPPMRMPDLAPTLCYLVDLPVAQYMEGRVMSEVIEPEFLETHPLRVVD